MTYTPEVDRSSGGNDGAPPGGNPVQIPRTARILLLDLQGERCEMSNYHFAQVKEFLRANGYATVFRRVSLFHKGPESISLPELGGADVVVLNGCAVFDAVADRGQDWVRRLAVAYPSKTFIVFGCLAALAGAGRSSPNVLRRFVADAGSLA